jgi:hypothetical protein
MRSSEQFDKLRPRHCGIDGFDYRDVYYPKPSAPRLRGSPLILSDWHCRLPEAPSRWLRHDLHWPHSAADTDPLPFLRASASDFARDAVSICVQPEATTGQRYIYSGSTDGRIHVRDHT